jgi:flagellin
MPIGILNNIASLAAENNLSTTNTNLQSVLLQLSSGQRINSGADDAAGLAIANGLQANISALTQSASNANNGVGELQVADGALSQVTNLLNRAVTLATESSTGTVSDSQRSAIQAEFSQITQEIDQIGGNTTFNGAAVFAGGSANFNQLVSAVGDKGQGMATAVTGNLTVKEWNAAGAAYGAVQTFNATTTDANTGTVAGLIENINSSGDGLFATLNSTGNLMITDAQNRGTTAGTELADGGATTLKIGSDAAAETFTNATTSSTKNIFLSDSTAAGSETIGVTLGTFNSSNMNGISLASDNLSTAATAQQTLIDLNNAIAQVAALRGNLGASVNRLQSASNVVSSQVQNVTSAENTIMAADIPTTVAKMTSDSILEQTGISALAQANQQQQLVLKLLQ